MDKATKTRFHPGAWALAALGHLTAVAIVTLGLAWLIAPLDVALPIYKFALTEEVFREQTFLQMGLHVGLSTCIWAAVYLLGAFVLSWRTKPDRVIRVARGTVMTETIIVLPVFMLLSFGLAQLAINNIAGILANVASYQAARAAWVWKGEEGKSRINNVGSNEARTRARLAAALVMTPVAPGEFVGNPTMGNATAQNMRESLALANIPLAGPYIPAGITNFGTNVFGTGLNMTTRSGQSFIAALDTSMYAIRGIRKFTHAWHATNVTVSDSSNGDTSISLTYRHFVAMPIMGRVFGNFGVVGLRPGYYSEFNRTYGFQSLSKTPPNTNLPGGTLLNFSIGGPGFGEAIRGEVGDF